MKVHAHQRQNPDRWVIALENDVKESMDIVRLVAQNERYQKGIKTNNMQDIADSLQRILNAYLTERMFDYDAYQRILYIYRLFIDQYRDFASIHAFMRAREHDGWYNAKYSPINWSDIEEEG